MQKATATAAHGAVSFSLPGTSETSTWDQLDNSNPYWADNGYPTTYPGAAPWPASIAPNGAASTGDAEFMKVSGGGYFAGSSIYDAGSSGTFSVTDTSALAGLSTIILQVDAGTPVGVAPVLNYNGGSQALAAGFFAVVDGDHETVDFGTGATSPTANHVWQWDLSGLGVSSYEIVWGSTADNHLTQYEISLTAGDTYAPVQGVPEPSAALLGAATLLLLARRRR